jgi:transposase
MAYETKFRERVISFLNEGNTQEEAKDVFKVGLTAIKRWVKQWKIEGNLERKPPNQSFKKIDPELLKEYIKNNSDLYLREIGEYFGTSAVAVHKVLKKLKITLKKRSHYTQRETLKNEPLLIKKSQDTRKKT